MFRIDHDADKLGGVLPDEAVDMDEVKEIVGKLIDDPQGMLGDKKSMTLEFIQEGVKDPNTLMAMTILFTKGIEAAAILHALESKTKEAMATMEIHPDMPKEMKEAIRQAKAAAGTTEDETLTEDVDDEFEQLKRKYQ